MVRDPSGETPNDAGKEACPITSLRKRRMDVDDICFNVMCTICSAGFGMSIWASGIRIGTAPHSEHNQTSERDITARNVETFYALHTKMCVKGAGVATGVERSRREFARAISPE